MTERPTVAFIPPSCCGAGYFRRLRRVLHDRVDVRAVELPGHGRRYREPPETRADVAVHDVLEQIGGGVDAVYGESLGAYLGLAVAALVDQPARPMLFAASNSPPRFRQRIRVERMDSVAAGATLLRAMGGAIPAEVVNDPELARQAYPLIRADLHLAQSLIASTRRTRIAGDIQVIAGTGDPSVTHLDSWATHTTGHCAVSRLPGGHLLSADNPTGVADVVLRTFRLGR